MKVNKYIIASFMILLNYNISFAQTEKEVSLNDALNQMYNTHESIKENELNLQEKKLQRNAAWGLYAPRIDLHAGYIYMSEDATMDVDLTGLKSSLSSGFGSLAMGQINHIGNLISQIPIITPEQQQAILQGMSESTKKELEALNSKIPNSMEQKIQDRDFFSFGASMIWPIFTGGRIYAANMAAGARYDIAKSGNIDNRNSLGASLVERYFSVVLSNEMILVKREMVTSMEEHYEKAQKLEKAGMLAKVERLHAAMSLSNAQKSLDNSIRQGNLAQSALKSIMNSENETLKPTTPLFLLNMSSIDPVTYFQDLAVSKNTKLKQGKSGEKLAKAAVVNSAASLWPHINVFANAKIYDYNLTSMTPDALVGVQMSFNLFNGAKDYHNLKAAKSLEKSVKLKVERAEKDLKTLVEQLYMSMENARADFDNSKKTQEFAQEYLRAKRKAFNQGMATSLDVVDAELNLSSARMEALLAAYRFDIALVKLLEVSGIFDSFETYRGRAIAEPTLTHKTASNK